MLNDLWSFDIPSKHWTFLAGSHNGGDKGSFPDRVGDTGVPFARAGCFYWTTIDNKELVIFGGLNRNFTPSINFLIILHYRKHSSVQRPMVL